MQCPICNGSGLICPSKIPRNRKETILLKREAVFMLKEKGYSHREIMSIMGYKSTRSISEHLRKYRR